MSEESEIRRELENLRASLAALPRDIERLEHAIARQNSETAYADLLRLAEIASATVGRGQHRALLQSVAEAARRLLRARGASILLVDHAANELVFEAASGGADVVGLRIPANSGIAGWVVTSGEPIAVADVNRDPRWARNFAERVGYLPKSIIAIPLTVADSVEGVLEVLDKEDGTSFDFDDIGMLSLLARPAATGLEQARVLSDISGILIDHVRQLALDGGKPEVAASVEALLKDAAHTRQRTLELARLVFQISRRGDRASQMALDVLSAIAKFAL